MFSYLGEILNGKGSLCAAVPPPSTDKPRTESSLLCSNESHLMQDSARGPRQEAHRKSRDYSLVSENLARTIALVRSFG
jgi:hypothetical protein